MMAAFLGHPGRSSMNDYAAASEVVAGLGHNSVGTERTMIEAFMLEVRDAEFAALQQHLVATKSINPLTSLQCEWGGL